MKLYVPLRALIAACTVLMAVGVLTGAVRASYGQPGAHLPLGVTIAR